MKFDMEAINLKSWSEFLTILEDIKQEYGVHKFGDLEEKNDILYRGQADSKWNLRTTLERFSKNSWTVLEYAKLARRVAPQIESFTGLNWNLPSDQEIRKKLEIKFPNLDLRYIPYYEFLVYLRHHGFPSPLLDWTYSPYVAAYFAFYEQNNAEQASIYAFIEMPKGGKGGWGGEVKISTMLPYIKTHKRHFLQQSWYTIATETDKNNKEHHFIHHEKVFDKKREDQDILIKINIPRSERLQVLEYLDSFNINYFSLFQTDDSLIRTLAFKEIEKYEF